jgi:ribA/ribD-fused uncharacterized protein
MDENTSLQRRLQANLVTDDAVYFYGGWLSSFAPISIVDRSPLVAWGRDSRRLYPTREHYFQAHKATNSLDFHRILSKTDCWDCKAEGNRILLREDWEEVKYEVMRRSIELQALAHTTFGNFLRETGRRKIYEDSPTDFIWGYRKGGKNLLGKALMEVRTTLGPEMANDG